MGRPAGRRAARLRCVLVMLVAAGLPLAGCQDDSGPLTLASPDNLALALEAVPPGDMFPSRLRVICRNTSDRPIRLVEPQPFWVDEEPVWDRDKPLVVLGLTFSPGISEKCWPAYSSDNPGKIAAATLQPGQTWSKAYPLDAFHLRGACGSAGRITEYLTSGSRELSVRAFLVFVGEKGDLHLYSSAIPLRCRWPHWMDSSAEDVTP